MLLQEALREEERKKKKQRKDNILNQRAARLVTLSGRHTSLPPL